MLWRPTHLQTTGWLATNIPWLIHLGPKQFLPMTCKSGTNSTPNVWWMDIPCRLKLRPICTLPCRPTNPTPHLSLGTKSIPRGAKTNKSSIATPKLLPLVSKRFQAGLHRPNSITTRNIHLTPIRINGTPYLLRTRGAPIQPNKPLQPRGPPTTLVQAIKWAKPSFLVCPRGASPTHLCPVKLDATTDVDLVVRLRIRPDSAANRLADHPAMCVPVVELGDRSTGMVTPWSVADPITVHLGETPITCNGELRHTTICKVPCPTPTCNKAFLRIKLSQRLPTITITKWTQWRKSNSLRISLSLWSRCCSDLNNKKTICVNMIQWSKTDVWYKRQFFLWIHMPSTSGQPLVFDVGLKFGAVHKDVVQK